jgi:hypothetical protein
MGKNEARRQKQLAKKKAKRDEKRQQWARQTSNDPTIRLAGAATWPIIDALVPDNLWKQGMGQLILARKQPEGRIAMAVFLLDTYCLGVKNALWRLMGEADYRSFVRDQERKPGGLHQVTPEHFAKLIYGAVDYAHSFGFAPHADYRPAKMLLQGIDPALCTDTFEYGKDGKPFYISGPHDSPDKIRSIMHRIQDAGGHFLVAARSADELTELVDEGEFEEDREEQQ